MTGHDEPAPATTRVPDSEPGPLLEQVREWLVRTGSDPTAPALRKALDEIGVVAEPVVITELGTRLHRDLLGAGPLQTLLARPGVTDVVVNGTDGVWFDAGAGMRRSRVSFDNDHDVRRLAQRLAAQANRRLDDAQPFVDARLPDGTRLHAALAPVAAPGTLISLRVPAARQFSLEALIAQGTIGRAGADWLRAVVRAKLSYLICGGTGSGKTTLLRGLLELVPPDERLLVIEESAELRPSHPHCVRLEGRPANAEMSGAIGLSDLMRQAMRMRPDRIVVGEVRGPEVTQLLAAMNTGHEGCCGTIHANDAEAIPARLEALALAAGMDRDAVHSQIGAGLDVVIAIRRTGAGDRRVDGIGVCALTGDRVRVRRLVTFRADRPLVHDPSHPLLGRLLRGMQA